MVHWEQTIDTAKPLLYNPRLLPLLTSSQLNLELPHYRLIVKMSSSVLDQLLEIGVDKQYAELAAQENNNGKPPQPHLPLQLLT